MTRALTIGLGLALMVCLALAVRQNSASPWRQLLEEYRRIDPKGAAQHPIQIPTPTGELDRCPTCHQSVLPDKKQLAQGPLKKHPKIPGHPDLSRFGCTPCHGGQGRRLDMLAHTPRLGAGLRPFLGQPFVQASCARCHVPTGLPGAPALDHGFKEYVEASCTGCHQPGRLEEGLGPDLRYIGRRTAAELKKALLDPRAGHSPAVMWSFAWRYDQATEQGRRTLDHLITALLVMAESPTPFRSHWVQPAIRVDQPCTDCHDLSKGGAATTGRAHRCTMLKQVEDLRCPRCHNKETPQPDQARGGECPQIQAALPRCAVCHLRPGDGAGPAKR